MYTSITQSLPIALQSVVVMTEGLKEIPAYLSPGRGFVNSDTYELIEDAVSWKHVFTHDMISKNEHLKDFNQ